MKPSERIHEIASRYAVDIGNGNKVYNVHPEHILEYLDEQHTHPASPPADETAATPADLADLIFGWLCSRNGGELCEAIHGISVESMRLAREELALILTHRGRPPNWAQDDQPAPSPTDEPGKAGGAKCPRCIDGSIDSYAGWIDCPDCKGTGQSEGTGAEGEDPSPAVRAVRLVVGWKRTCAEHGEPTNCINSQTEELLERIEFELNTVSALAESRGAERGRKEERAECVAYYNEIRDQLYEGLECDGHRMWSDDIIPRAHQVMRERREFESKLAAAEKERDEAREQAAEYEQMRLDERTALGPQLRELTAARDALSKKVEAFIERREGFHMTFNGGWHDDPAHEAFHHGMDTVFNALEADFRPGEREAKGEAR